MSSQIKVFMSTWSCPAWQRRRGKLDIYQIYIQRNSTSNFRISHEVLLLPTTNSCSFLTYKVHSFLMPSLAVVQAVAIFLLALEGWWNAAEMLRSELNRNLKVSFLTNLLACNNLLRKDLNPFPSYLLLRCILWLLSTDGSRMLMLSPGTPVPKLFVGPRWHWDAEFFVVTTLQILALRVLTLS